MKNLIQILQDLGEYSIFLDTLGKTDLVDTICEIGPFTIFAPVNYAFSKLPQNALDKIMRDQFKRDELIRYHLVKGNFKIEQLSSVRSLRTLTNKFLQVDEINSVIVVNQARIIHPDIPATNGIIQGIDMPLISLI